MSITENEVITTGQQAQWINFKEYDTRWSGYWFKLRCSNCGFVVPDGVGATEQVCNGCGARMERSAMSHSAISLSEVVI